MKKRALYTVLIMSVFVTACKKNIKEPPDSNISVHPMLKSIEWPSLSRKTSIEYNSDSTISKCITTGGSNTIVKNYSYGSQGLIQIYSDASLAQNIFEYDQKSRNLIKMSRTIKESTGLRVYRFLDFSYHSNGTLAAIKLFSNNSSAPVLNYTATVNYDRNTNMPSQIKTVDANGNGFLFDIEGYSSEVLFDPLYFFDEQITELFPVYNLPLLRFLSQRHRLPAVIKITEFKNSHSSLYKQLDTQFEISSQKIQREISKVTDPVTSSTSELEVLFKY